MIPFGSPPPIVELRDRLRGPEEGGGAAFDEGGGEPAPEIEARDTGLRLGADRFNVADRVRDDAVGDRSELFGVGGVGSDMAKRRNEKGDAIRSHTPNNNKDMCREGNAHESAECVCVCILCAPLCVRVV